MPDVSGPIANLWQYTKRVGARLAREGGSSGSEMFADCSGLFAGKPRSNRSTYSPGTYFPNTSSTKSTKCRSLGKR